MNDDLLLKLAVVVPIFIASISLHELAHAAMADALGDPTAREEGRLTANPVAHLDPMGTVVLIISSMAGFGFGWAKPVPVKAHLLRWPRFGMVLVSAAGPFANLVLAATAIVILKMGPVMPQGSVHWLVIMASLNIVLLVLNMLPVPPLDGSNIVEAILPRKWLPAYEEVAKIGPLVLLFLFMMPNAYNPLVWVFERAVRLAFSL